LVSAGGVPRDLPYGKVNFRPFERADIRFIEAEASGGIGVRLASGRSKKRP